MFLLVLNNFRLKINPGQKVLEELRQRVKFFVLFSKCTDHYNFDFNLPSMLSPMFFSVALIHIVKQFSIAWTGSWKEREAVLQECT